MDVYAFFFFSSRRRHTRLQGDWSSDVCSPDLDLLVRLRASHAVEGFRRLQPLRQVHTCMDHGVPPAAPRKLREPSNDCPPSHTQIAPVMYAAASDDRNNARSAISSLVAKRPNGTLAIAWRRASSVGASRRMPSVSSTGPGAIAFTRTPAAAHSIASVLEKMSMPALAAHTCA